MIKEIFVKYEDPKFKTIQINSTGNWIDLKAAEDVVLEPGEFKLISLGVAMKLPTGYEALLAPRSSTFKKYNIIQTNSVGIIDETYCGNDDVWKMPVYALGKCVISKGERIAQFRVISSMKLADRISDVYGNDTSYDDKFVFVEVSELTDENRGGFGSTGR